jgi:hypothetical protein
MKNLVRDELQFGDLVMVKSFSFLGWAIGNSFREISPLRWYSGDIEVRHRPSNHTGIIGYDLHGRLCVFESLGRGVVRTSLDEYELAVIEGRAELKFARVAFADWTSPMVCNGEAWLALQVGKKYDFRSYISHIWRTVLRLPPLTEKGVQADRRFYCTELANKFLLYVGLFAPAGENMNALAHKLPTPYTVEKRIADGRLAIIEEWH